MNFEIMPTPQTKGRCPKCGAILPDHRLTCTLKDASAADTVEE